MNFKKMVIGFITVFAITLLVSIGVTFFMEPGISWSCNN